MLCYRQFIVSVFFKVMLVQCSLIAILVFVLLVVIFGGINRLLLVFPFFILVDGENFFCSDDELLSLVAYNVAFFLATNLSIFCKRCKLVAMISAFAMFHRQSLRLHLSLILVFTGCRICYYCIVIVYLACLLYLYFYSTILRILFLFMSFLSSSSPIFVLCFFIAGICSSGCGQSKEVGGGCR